MKTKMKIKKIMTRLIMVSVLLFGIINAPKVLATDDGDLPSENDPFWGIMGNLNRPDDSDCVSVTATYFENTIGMTSIEANSEATIVCADLAQIPSEMTNSDDAGEGVETNLSTASNWHSVENLYFQHSTNGVVDGRIAFTQPIDFMSYKFMLFMQTFGERMDTGNARISLDADIVNGMAGYGAVLTMYNVPEFDDPVILVNGEEDSNGVVSGLVYDATNRTITFNAAHFTAFSAVERSSLGMMPKINKVKARKFTTRTGKEVIKLTIYGKRFKKSSVVKLGSKKAFKVRKKSSKKIVAYFRMNDVKKLGKKKLKVRVINSSNTKLFKHKLKLKKIKWLLGL